MKQPAVTSAVLRRMGFALRLRGMGSGRATSGSWAQRFSSSAVRCAMQMGVAKNEKLHSTSCISSFKMRIAWDVMTLLFPVP